MSLEKAILHKKEHRKPWRGSKNFDKTCRNHGGCDWCKGNRLYSSTKELERCKEQMKGEYSCSSQAEKADRLIRYSCTSDLWVRND